MSGWMLASCAYQKEKPEMISFAVGGAVSGEFRASKVFSIMGKTYANDSLTRLSDDDIKYLNSLSSRQESTAYADNILITLYRGDKQLSKMITWDKNNASLISIATTLDK